MVVAYAAGIAFGLWAWFGPGRMTDTAAVVGWSVAIVVGSAFAARRYRSAPGIDRQRLQLFAAGAVAAIELGLVVGGLAAAGQVAGATPGPLPPGARCWCRSGVGAASFPRPLATSDRVLVWLLTVTGLSAVVLAVYLLVILGFGHDPGPADREVLGLSILAAAIVALGASVFHQRVTAGWPQRLVYGTDAVPDDVVKTFSTRLTRAVTMDELLLQFDRVPPQVDGADQCRGLHRHPTRSSSAARRSPTVVRVPCTSDRSSSRWWPGPACRATPGQQCGCRRSSPGGTVPSFGCARSPMAESCWAWRCVERPDHRAALHRGGGPGPGRAVPPGGPWPCTTSGWTRPSSPPWMRFGARPLSCAPRGPASWPPPTPSAAGWSATCTTGPSSTWWPWPSTSGWSATWWPRTPTRPPHALDEIAGEVKATVQELRDLAHGIYPPLLMDNGLPEALRAVAASSPLDVEPSAEGIGRFSPDIEAAVYFCCLEALQNAAKHAPGSQVELRVWEEEGGLLFTVSDDGPGFDPRSPRPATAS